MPNRIASALLLFVGCGISLQAQCTNSVLTGTYFYLLDGSLISGSQAVPYAELGKLVADGQGNVTGQSEASVNGTLGAYSLSGTYTVQANCTGSMTLTVNSSGTALFDFEVVSGGEGILVTFSGPGGVVVGRAYQTMPGLSQCGTQSFSGS
jgi:hypothetical protein